MNKSVSENVNENSFENNMYYVVEKLKRICIEKNWTPYMLARECGIPYSSINNMFKRYTDPTISNMRKLCKGLNITMSDFFSDENDEVVLLSNDARDMLEIYNRLSNEQKGRLKAFLAGMTDNELSS